MAHSESNSDEEELASPCGQGTHSQVFFVYQQIFKDFICDKNISIIFDIILPKFYYFSYLFAHVDHLCMGSRRAEIGTSGWSWI